MGKMATREAYGRTLQEIGSDEKIVVFDADLAGSTNTGRFKKDFPERFFDMGIAEANMVACAAGMATCGKTAFVSSFAMFATERACEQIRNSVCYPKLNVKVCASHAGITVGEDGASHQCLEDLSIMRSLPNMTVLCPADAASARMAVKAAYENDGPFYVRLARLATDSVYGEFGEDVDFTLGKAHMVKDGTDVTIIACGYMVEQAIEALNILESEGISARLLDMHTIKPIDKEAIIKAS
jgi:transketolase